MEETRLKSIFRKMGECSIGVIGDFCLDAYWLIDEGPAEYSIETGKKTFGVSKQRYSLGGAGNVTWNLVDIGIKKAYSFGVLGDDLFGREMLNLLNKLNVDTSGIIIQNQNWDTPVYSKPFIGLEEQERIDFGRFNKISHESEEKLLSVLKDKMKTLDALIVNQQLVNGIHSDKMINELNKLFLEFPQKIFLLDSRNKNDKFFNLYFKINATEAARLCGVHAEISESISLEDLKKYSQEIFKRSKKTVFISRGNRGLVIFDGKTFSEIPGLLIYNKIDSVGAGDTVASAITACLSSGASAIESAEIANLAAGITVQKLQITGTASQNEILEINASTDYIFKPELADDFRNSKFYLDTEIEVVNINSEVGKIEHIVFDHDGTISTLRQGWESIMEPVMVKSILGKQYDSVNEETYQRVVKRVQEYIDQSTGIETIVQMHSLVGLIKEFGIVPEEEILKPIEYKQIYNKELMNKVNFRLRKFEIGELDISDYTMKGVISFMDMLKKRGVKMYLASGTDTQDVIREAKALGYDHYFEGRIYGSLGDITKNAKRIVIENIINTNKLHGPQVAAFGDGPVELREVKKRGGIAVGVASNEVQRFGISFTKRSRLIKAGADFIIPDFSQYKHLFNMLLDKKSIEPSDLKTGEYKY